VTRALEPWEDGCRVAIGTCGSGKSYGIKRDLYAAHERFPIIIIDSAGEWRKGPPGTVLARDVEHAKTAFKNKARIAIIRPDDDPGPLVEEAFAWAIGRSRDDAKHACAGVAVSEAAMVWPNGCRLSKNVRRAMTQWRHYHVASWIDVQRVAELSTTITDLARETRVYATGGPHEIKRLHGMGGDELTSAVGECMRRFQAGGGARGTAQGWHVTLDESRMGPYEVTR
jgi:hypothetical protein